MIRLLADQLELRQRARSGFNWLVSTSLVAGPDGHQVLWQVLMDTYPKETEKEKTLYQSLGEQEGTRMENGGMVGVSQSICVTVSVVDT